MTGRVLLRIICGLGLVGIVLIGLQNGFDLALTLGVIFAVLGLIGPMGRTD